MKLLTSTLIFLTLSSTAHSATVVGTGLRTDGTAWTRGFTSGRTCMQELKSLDIQDNPGFWMETRSNMFDRQAYGFLAAYPWNNGQTIWICHQ